MMARYNGWQNASLVNAADGLNATARGLDRGAFFGSISRTFSHLLWGDMLWFSRIDGGAAPTAAAADNADAYPDWEDFKLRRGLMDARILHWAQGVDASDVAGDLSWHSDLTGGDVARAKSLVFTGVFIHQTHHRGQIHAMLTAAGAKPDVTDLIFMPDDVAFLNNT